MCKIFFLKKSWNCPNNLIYYTTDVCYPQPFYQQLFFTKFSTNFFTTFIYLHLCAPILSVRTSSYSWSSVKISSHSWSPVRISSFLWESFSNPSYLWKSLLIYDHPWKFFSTFFAFYNLCKNKQVYEYYHPKQIFYHQITIMIFCWFCMFQFYVFYFKFFLFCVWLLLYQIKCL